MTTFNWTIEQLETQVKSGGVITAYWRVVAEDQDYNTFAYGSIYFTPQPFDPNFIPYSDLTEDDVLSWVWRQMNKGEIEGRLEKELQAKKAPETITGLPW